MLPELIKSQVLPMDEFQNYLVKKAKEGLSPEAVSSAVIELALSEGEYKFLKNLNLKGLDSKTKDLVIGKIKLFENSKDSKKQDVFEILSEEKENALKENDSTKLKNLLNLGFIKINDVSTGGHSLLLEAAYYEAQNVIDYLISNPDFDISRKNNHGLNDIEELRLLGKSELADYIEQKRPESKSRKFEVKERNTQIKTALYPNGTPIIDFVRIEPGTFRMGQDRWGIVYFAATVTTITKPFEMMSTQTTQKMWKDIVDLANVHLKGKYSSLKTEPSNFKGDMNPVEQVSHIDVSLWNQAASELSKMDDLQIQKAISDIFPGHKKGDQYRLPTDAEWEYVARVQGLATGKYTHGNTDKNLSDYAWSDQNSGRRSPTR